MNLDFARNEPDIVLMGNTARCANLDIVEHITDVGVEAILNNCKKLSKIDLSGTKITNKTLELIVGLKNITVLKVYSCWNLNKEEIEDLAKKRPDLKIIDSRSELDATAAFQELVSGTKSRYLLLEPIPNSRSIHIKMQPHVSDKEKELIAPSVFMH